MGVLITGGYLGVNREFFAFFCLNTWHEDGENRDIMRRVAKRSFVNFMSNFRFIKNGITKDLNRSLIILELYRIFY